MLGDKASDEEEELLNLNFWFPLNLIFL